jgi:hypothetical protein
MAIFCPVFAPVPQEWLRIARCACGSDNRALQQAISQRTSSLLIGLSKADLEPMAGNVEIIDLGIGMKCTEPLPSLARFGCQTNEVRH